MADEQQGPTREDLIEDLKAMRETYIGKFDSLVQLTRTLMNSVSVKKLYQEILASISNQCTTKIKMIDKQIKRRSKKQPKPQTLVIKTPVVAAHPMKRPVKTEAVKLDQKRVNEPRLFQQFCKSSQPENGQMDEQLHESASDKEPEAPIQPACDVDDSDSDKLSCLVSDRPEESQPGLFERMRTASRKWDPWDREERQKLIDFLNNNPGYLSSKDGSWDRLMKLFPNRRQITVYQYCRQLAREGIVTFQSKFNRTSFSEREKQAFYDAIEQQVYTDEIDFADVAKTVKTQNEEQCRQFYNKCKMLVRTGRHCERAELFE